MNTFEGREYQQQRIPVLQVIAKRIGEKRHRLQSVSYQRRPKHHEPPLYPALTYYNIICTICIIYRYWVYIVFFYFYVYRRL